MEGAWSGVEWREGGGSAHSPELVVARVLVVTHVLIATRVLIARELRWPFWLVVVCMHHGSWGMVNGARWWVVIATCGQWILAGDHSQAVGGCHGCCLCCSVGAGRPLGAAVAGCGRRWLSLFVAVHGHCGCHCICCVGGHGRSLCVLMVVVRKAVTTKHCLLLITNK